MMAGRERGEKGKEEHEGDTVKHEFRNQKTFCSCRETLALTSFLITACNLLNTQAKFVFSQISNQPLIQNRPPRVSSRMC